MWQDKIKEIIYLLDNSDMNEIDITFWGRRFRVVKKPHIVSESNKTLDTPDSIEKQSHSEQQAEPVFEPEQDGDKVLAPMPGTFYRSSSPDKDSFVEEGDTVNKGDTLCIIEAMKIMNEIEAESNGLVKNILIKDGTPVEYDQPLFIISPVT